MFIYSANLGSDPRPVTRGVSEGFNQRTCNIRAVSYWICHVSEICSEIFGTSSYWFSLLWVDRRRIYSLFPFYWTSLRAGLTRIWVQSSYWLFNVQASLEIFVHRKVKNPNLFPVCLCIGMFLLFSVCIR